MLWEYERKELPDRRFDAYLVEKGNQGWELVYARRGKQTRVNSDPDWWEVIFKRPKAAAPLETCDSADATQEIGMATADAS